jgi:dihydrofolate reductase
MRKLVVFESLSLDGVMQAPAGTNEDTRGGFTRGGWALPYDDKVKGKAIAKSMARLGPLLFGRRTYEHMFETWHGRNDGNPFTDVLDKAEKYVVSNTLKDPLPWENSALIKGDPAAAIAHLKSERGKDIVILGSGELVRSLMPTKLIDDYLLLIHPLVLGQGRRLFPDDGGFAELTVIDSVTTTKGVVIATYRQARAV